MDKVPSDSPSGKPNNRASDDESGELLGNADYPLLFQSSSESCLLCKFLNSPEVSKLSLIGTGFTGPANDCEVFHKLTHLSNLQPDVAEKESPIMSTSLSPNNNQTVSSARVANTSPEAQASGALYSIDQQAHQKISGVQTQSQATAHRIRIMQEQIHQLSDQVSMLNYSLEKSQQKHQEDLLHLGQRHRIELNQARQQSTAKRPHSRNAAGRIPEPRRQASTYRVPKRNQPTWASKALSGTPFFLFMSGLGLVLSLAVYIAYPSAIMWTSFTGILTAVLPIMFLTGIFSLGIMTALDMAR